MKARETKKKLYVISNSDWDRIKDFFPREHPAEGKRGRPSKYDNRSIWNGIMWIDRTGAPWRTLPKSYGKWETVYARYRKWLKEGVFFNI